LELFVCSAVLAKAFNGLISQLLIEDLITGWGYG
jgi:hypothetical protein